MKWKILLFWPTGPAMMAKTLLNADHVTSQCFPLVWSYVQRCVSAWSPNCILLHASGIELYEAMPISLSQLIALWTKGESGTSFIPLVRQTLNLWVAENKGLEFKLIHFRTNKMHDYKQWLQKHWLHRENIMHLS